jgi:hypothetical protein
MKKVRDRLIFLYDSINIRLSFIRKNLVILSWSLFKVKTQKIVSTLLIKNFKKYRLGQKVAFNLKPHKNYIWTLCTFLKTDTLTSIRFKNSTFSTSLHHCVKRTQTQIRNRFRWTSFQSTGFQLPIFGLQTLNERGRQSTK